MEMEKEKKDQQKEASEFPQTAAKPGDVSKYINLGYPSNTQIFGAPGSGKTHLIKYLVYERYKRKSFKRIYVIVSTAFTHEYDWVEEDYIVDNNYDEAIDFILEQQKDMVPCLVIFDDITGSINWYSGRYNRFFTEYRKRNMSIILSITMPTRLLLQSEKQLTMLLFSINKVKLQSKLCMQPLDTHSNERMSLQSI
jgi:hypothetical protein